MSKKKVVVALGHRALGTTMPEQYKATRKTAKAIADLVEAGADVVISHSNAPQVGMIHTAMNEFSKEREDYTQAPMSVCSAMSQGYVGYDLQNAIRAELLKRGVYRPVCTIITQVMVDPYDDAFTEPVKVIGRLLSKEEAEQEEKHGNYVTEVEGGYRRIVAAPKPQGIIEIRELILRLNHERQITVLISSHILDELSRLATHYGFIDSGRIVRELSAEELEAACRKCIRIEVSNTGTLACVLDEMKLDYKILTDTEAYVYAKVNVTELVLALAERDCEVFSVQEKEESLESYYVSLVGGGKNE